MIEVHLDLGGWPVTLLDTAGIRETDDPVELEGVRRARERAHGADLVLWVVDAGQSAVRKMLQRGRSKGIVARRANKASIRNDEFAIRPDNLADSQQNRPDFGRRTKN